MTKDDNLPTSHYTPASEIARLVREAPLIDLFEPSSPTRPRHDSEIRRRSWVHDQSVANCSDCQRRFAFSFVVIIVDNVDVFFAVTVLIIELLVWVDLMTPITTAFGNQYIF